jgi:hypothetical protein
MLDTKSVYCPKRKSLKILMIRDSHVKNCATELQQNLHAHYEVSNFVKPGAGMNTIVNITTEEIKDLRSEDVVVIWGVANVSKEDTSDNFEMEVRSHGHWLGRN